MSKPDQLTLLTTRRGLLAVKTFTKTKAGIDVQGYDHAKHFTREVIDVDDKGKWLKRIADERHSFATLGAPNDNWPQGAVRRRLSASGEDGQATLEDVPRLWLPVDIDEIDFTPDAPLSDGEYFALEVMDMLRLPKRTHCVWHLTGSHGVEGRYRIRLWVKLARAMTCAQMKRFARAKWKHLSGVVDLSVYAPAQPIYTGAPVFVGMDDPVERRVGYIAGRPLRAEAPEGEDEKDFDPRPDDPYIAVLQNAGLYIRPMGENTGRHAIRCPWEDEHKSPSNNDTSTTYLAPHYGGHDIPVFYCRHNTCKDVNKRTWDDVAHRYGLNFVPVEECEDDESVETDRRNAGSLVTVKASDVKIEPVEWLWEDRIALGKVTVVAGHPGGGKSQATCDIAARVTTGAKWPVEGGRARVGSVLMLSAEDSAADTIAPRLKAARADLRRVHLVESVEDAKGERGFDLLADTKRLEAKLVELRDVRLVVVDPITAYSGVAKVDWNSAGDVRGFIRPLTELAERHRVAVVIVQHMRKDTSAHNAQMAVSGSVGLVAAARAVWTVTKDKDDEERMLFLAAKNNLARVTGRGLAYYIESTEVEGDDGARIKTSHVAWEKELVNMTADEALRASNEDGGSRRTKEQTTEWLERLLGDKPLTTGEVRQAAKDAGYSWGTLQRVKDGLGIKPKKRGFSDVWEWSLPGWGEP